MRVTRSARLTPLRGRTICIIGYGSQGRAQALNIRDSGFRPIIGLPSHSRSRKLAVRDRMVVRTTPKAVRDADAIFLLAPDHLHGVIFKRDIAPHLRPGVMLVFAHASSIHFGLLKPPEKADIVLIAPLGPGKRLRELRGRADGLACFFAVHRDFSGRARKFGLALAKAIGCLPAGAIETTFAEEAVGDLFGEQVVLCGGLPALMQAAVETLVRHGMRPENAYLECVYQLDLIVDLMKSEGLKGMYSQISPTAAYGAAVAGRRLVVPSVKRAMNALHQEIASGRFMHRWVAASQSAKAMRPEVSKQFARGEAIVLQALSPSRRAAS
jgi:ketol-acid reductoisomerase